MFFIDFSPVKTDKKSDLDYDILELQKYDILAVTRQHRKIRMMETKSKRMKRLKDKKTSISEKHKKLMNKGMKMLINSDSDANLG
jgi:hypothetical protein